ncbi:hypothetical protein GQ600_3332 [Phytophthora cactorum]|nr:hypothetical protein GQ600_3332 [Phytophthora cactorum]
MNQNAPGVCVWGGGGLKSFDIDKSQTIACTIFPQAKHKIRYRLLVYSSQAVSKASALKRTWRVWQQQRGTSPPRRKTLSSTQRVFPREHVETIHAQCGSGTRAPGEAPHKFSIPLEELPALNTVQSFYESLPADIHGEPRPRAGAQGLAFTLGWQTDNTGNPIVGNGFDEKPFVVGLSTKALMLMLNISHQASCYT